MPRQAKSTDALASILASGALGRIALYFAVHPAKAPHGRALQRATGLGPRSLTTELERLTRLGVVERQTVGGGRPAYAVREHHPRWLALRQVVREYADPVAAAGIALADLPGVRAACLVKKPGVDPPAEAGSGEILVAGDTVDRATLAEAAGRLEVLLGRGPKMTFLTRLLARVRMEMQPTFKAEISGADTRWLIGDESDFWAWLQAQNQPAETHPSAG